ncbi:MAG: type IX secretion system sortase PorU [Prevotellaceae bacterium]|nr:type IX secretion system sortase PorU [Prevotellaceae bacterium]
MKIKKASLLILLLLVCCIAKADGKRQKFFNLTADEVKIDSVLPVFSYSVPLSGAYSDSVYTVSLEYAEYIDMSDADIERYQKITEEALPEIPQIESNIVVERKRGHLELLLTPLAYRKGKYKKLVSFMLDIKSTASSSSKKANTRATTTASERYASNSILAEGTWAKIRVPSTGIYQLTESLIRSAGFTDLSKIKIYGYGGALQDETFEESYLIETDDLSEVPTCTVDGKRLFHAQGPVSWSSNTATRRTRNPYSDYGYYFITESDETPLTVDSLEFVDAFYPSADDYHTLHEIDNYAWYQGGRNLFENTPISAGSSQTYTITLDQGITGSGVVSVCVTAGQATSLQIAVNGVTKGTYSLSFGDYDRGKSVTGNYSVSDLSSSNTVTITTLSGGPARLDYISIYHDSIRQRPILANTTFSAPEYVYNITNQNHHADGAADMIIIVPTSGILNTQAQRIKELHEEHDSMTVRIVPADELYNEFSSGTPDANAYRRYLKMLYDRAETEDEMPSYLLLFGDCVWDNRLNTTECSSLDADNLLLCHESENSFSATDCYVDDGFFCLLDDGEGGQPARSDKLDMAVGRFPVRDATEAKIMVDKTIAYVENENAGSWQNIMMFMGDDGNSNRHMTDANQMATLVESINPAFYTKRVMWDAYTRVSSSTGNTYPDVTKVIKQQQNSGALIMNYSGHGSETQISHEKVLSITDFAEFTNTNQPLWITASCDIMPFDSQESNIGETAVLNENGGAVAFFGTTRTVWVDRNNAINQAYLNALLTPVSGKYISIGEAQRQAKNNLITSRRDTTVNKLQYSLLGDPALVLNVPLNRVVIDSINGIDLVNGDSIPSLSAGSIATITGHINNADGTEDTSFNGVVNAVVRDAEKLVTCKLNDTSSDGASTPYTYYDRTTVLYNGSDSVRAGTFTITFAVPMDIDYSNESGMINIFAVNESTLESVNGYSEDFIVGGSSSVNNDSIGPSIYCYLNSTSFTNGDKVNTTPYFIAQVYDKDGINASGSGIGHDMVLVIDGEMSKTYTLNDYFEYDFGSYTSGNVYYSIPELETGTHTLKFRAWDVLNNSSTAELTFNVVEGLTPNVNSISCTPNPATTNTKFIVNHDRSGSSVNVGIEVFDMTGRLVWKNQEDDVTTTGAYTYTWDLTNGNGGKLNTGVYLYRVKVSSSGTGYTSKARKLIIVH